MNRWIKRPADWLAPFVLSMMMLTNAFAAPVCDPAVDACKSAKQGYLMMCACLSGRSDLEFSGLDLRKAVFTCKNSDEPLNFSGADLRGANLEGSDILRRASLSAANLRGANLEGADLFGASGLTSAQLSGATFNARTVLPLENSIRTDEFGKPTQYRRAGCGLGMLWRDHDPETGIAENCEGAVTQLQLPANETAHEDLQQYQGSISQNKETEAVPDVARNPGALIQAGRAH